MTQTPAKLNQGLSADGVSVCNMLTDADYVDIEEWQVRVCREGKIINLRSGKALSPFTFLPNCAVPALAVNIPRIGKQDRIKQMVYKAFNGEVTSKVMHKDGNYKNCHADNLYLQGQVVDEVIDRNIKNYEGTDYSRLPAPFTRYIIHKAGKVIDLMTCNEHQGHVRTSEYVIVKLIKDSGESRMTYLHRAVFWAFNWDFDFHDPEKQVNHMDGDTKNNDLSNLEEATSQENRIHAVKLNPNASIKGGDTHAIPVEVISADGTITVFEKVEELTKLHKCSSSTIRNYIKSGKEYKGKTLRYKFDDRSNEQWFRIKKVDLPDWAPKAIINLEGLYVSNHGRIVNTRGYEIKPEYNKTGYRHFMFAGSGRTFHQVLCFAFRGPPPSELHTADHGNKDNKDNDPVKLSWKDKNEQSANTKVSCTIKVTCIQTGEQNTYRSRALASRMTGVGQTRIIDVAKTGKASKGYIFENVVLEQPVFSKEPIAADPTVTDPVEYDFIRKLVQRGTTI